MKTKSIQGIFLASILALVWCSGVWAEDPRPKGTKQRMQKQTERVNKKPININARRNTQSRGILNGVSNGDLTRNEYRRLNKEQHRIDRAYRRSVSDGYLSSQERQRLQKMQDRANRRIYGAKQNYATRESFRDDRRHDQRRPVVHRHDEKRYYGSYPTRTRSFNGYGFSSTISESGWQVVFSIGGVL